MQIVYDCYGMLDGTSETRGIGRYASNHLLAMLAIAPEHRWVLAYPDNGDATGLRSSFPAGVSVEFIGYKELNLSDFDIVHISDPMSQAPERVEFIDKSMDTNLTILFHDLIPLIKHRDHFDFWEPQEAFTYLARLEAFSTRCATIFTNSENTARDFKRFTNASAPITPIFAGTSLAEFETEGGWQKKFGNYLLVVGALDSHKGFAYTFTAFTKLCEHFGDINLVITGSLKDPYKDVYRKLANDMGCADKVKFTGFVSDSELKGLYAEALGLVFPSFYEGFGFPVLEAMALGCPVITRKNSSLEEVGGDAVLYVDNPNFPENLFRLVTDASLRQELRRKGLERSALFSWKNVAKATLDVWSSIVESTPEERFVAPASSI